MPNETAWLEASGAPSRPTRRGRTRLLTRFWLGYRGWDRVHSMRDAAVGLLCLLAIGPGGEALASGNAAAFPSPPERIVLIVIDMLRRDHLGVHGAEAATPNIDALAGRGQVYDRAVSGFPSTTMSMGPLFTGRTPSIEVGSSRQTLAWDGRAWKRRAKLGRTGKEYAQEGHRLQPGTNPDSTRSRSSVRRQNFSDSRRPPLGDGSWFRLTPPCRLDRASSSSPSSVA
jgi:hypothetical protein